MWITFDLSTFNVNNFVDNFWSLKPIKPSFLKVIHIIHIYIIINIYYIIKKKEEIL